MWQDWVIAAIQWIFVLALIPSLRHPTNKLPLSSSLLTGVLLLVLSGVFFTLSLWNGTLSSFVLSIAWLLLAWQRWKVDKKDKGVGD